LVYVGSKAQNIRVESMSPSHLQTRSSDQNERRHDIASLSCTELTCFAR
jgi:hypothetical protein